MALEDILTRIAVALEKQAGITPEKRGPGRPPKVKDEPAEAPPAEQPVAEEPAAVEAPAAPPPEARVYTAEDVRTALISYQKKTSPDKARTLLKEVGGADTLRSLKAEKYAAVIAAAEKA